MTGYIIDVFAEGLNTPTSILFTEEGELYIADSGYTSGHPTISRLVKDHFELFAENFNVPLTGISYHNGDIYISHKSIITVIRRNGIRQDIIAGPLSFGDYSNSSVDMGINPADNPDFFIPNTGVIWKVTRILCLEYKPLLHLISKGLFKILHTSHFSAFICTIFTSLSTYFTMFIFEHITFFCAAITYLSTKRTMFF